MNTRVSTPEREVAPLGRFATSGVGSRLLRQAAAQVESDPRSGPELRREARHRTYKGARIALSNGRATIYCLVRNLSRGGACISVNDEVSIPDLINLVFDSGEPSRVSRVVWRRARMMGLAFC